MPVVRISITGWRLAKSVDQLRETLAAYRTGQDSNIIAGQARSNRQPEIAFLFTGQGAQYVEMGRALYETQPVFRATLDRCDELLRPHLGQSLLAVLYPDSAAAATRHRSNGDRAARDLHIEYAPRCGSRGASCRRSHGAQRGEYVAACVAGV
jgi:acyl transferase domain-containing protein